MIDWLELLWRAAEEGQTQIPLAEGISKTLEGGRNITEALAALQIPFEGVDYDAAFRPGVGLLYRTVLEAVGPLVTANSLRERKIVEEEAPRPTGLTEGMLDRAMRRDSRRYDSGMTIY